MLSDGYWQMLAEVVHGDELREHGSSRNSTVTAGAAVVAGQLEAVEICARDGDDGGDRVRVAPSGPRPHVALPQALAVRNRGPLARTDRLREVERRRPKRLGDRAGERDEETTRGSAARRCDVERERMAGPRRPRARQIRVMPPVPAAPCPCGVCPAERGWRRRTAAARTAVDSRSASARTAARARVAGWPRSAEWSAPQVRSIQA